jgi:predicted Zn-dependent protease
VKARCGRALPLAALALACRAAAPPAPEVESEGAARRRAPTVLSTPQAEERVGREAAAEVEGSVGIVRDEALRRYVQQIGARLAREAPGFRYDYRFEIVDEGSPNAFALPGGRVFVSRGALALTASEDELANVIGHEIAHVAARHAAAQQQVAGGALMQALQFQSLAAYSRDLERSADRLGQGLAAVAGYDPNGMTGFLASLDRLDRIQRGGSRRPGFLDTHPGTPGRVHEMAQRAGTIHWTRAPGISAGPADHLRRLEGLVVGNAPAQGVFEGARFLHAELAFTLRFPDGWDTRNTPSAVGAIAPDRRMQIVLELAREGRDVAGAAAAWQQGFGRALAVREAGPVRVVGRDAFRVSGRLGELEVVSTFLAHAGRVFQLGCAGRDRVRVDALCTSAARSFRPMTAELLARVSEQRLALVEARPGETLAALGARSENAWTPAETAAWNGLAPTAAFTGGEAVKIARAQPYRPGPRK